MHYNTIFLAILTLFAAGTVSVGALPQNSQCAVSGEPCITFADCCPLLGLGIVYVCASVVSIFMLLYHCQLDASTTSVFYKSLIQLYKTRTPDSMFNLLQPYPHKNWNVFHCNSNWTNRRDSNVDVLHLLKHDINFDLVTIENLFEKSKPVHWQLVLVEWQTASNVGKIEINMSMQIWRSQRISANQRFGGAVLSTYQAVVVCLQVVILWSDNVLI